MLLPRQGGGPNERWWWYGESAKNETAADVNAYSSTDFVNWRFEGVVLSHTSVLASLKASSKKKHKKGKRNDRLAPPVPGAQDLFADTLQDPPVARNNHSDPRLIIERPKVIFSAKLSQFLMLVHLDHFAGKESPPPRYTWRMLGVASSASPGGPFRLVRVLRPDGLASLDIQVTQTMSDDDDSVAPAGSVFLTRSVDNRYLATSLLDVPSLLLSTAEEKDDANKKKKKKKKKKRKNKAEGDNVGAPLSRTMSPLEGPALFKVGGSWLMLASHLRGWLPSPLELLRLENASSLATRGGGFSAVGRSPTGSKTSHNSQPAFVVPMCDGQGQRYWIYVGDRWNYGSDTTLAAATYVMLPIVIRPRGSDSGGGVDDDKEVILPWRSSWNLDDPFPRGVGAFHRWMEEPSSQKVKASKEEVLSKKNRAQQKAREKKKKHKVQKAKQLEAIRAKQLNRQNAAQSLARNQNRLKMISQGILEDERQQQDLSETEGSGGENLSSEVQEQPQLLQPKEENIRDDGSGAGSAGNDDDDDDDDEGSGISTPLVLPGSKTKTNKRPLPVVVVTASRVG